MIEKYKNLIFSVPIKFGLSREDAADVFQIVCVELLTGLHNLREPKALPKWADADQLSPVPAAEERPVEPSRRCQGLEERLETNPEELPEAMFHQVEREQSVRGAMAALPERCNQMVAMLFFEDPPRPYGEVARQLQLATGSIGFIRGRCLKKLRQLLEEKGFR